MTGGVVASCLDLPDLWLAKATAGRPKDYQFCHDLANNKPVDKDALTTRLNSAPDLPDPVRTAVTTSITAASQPR